jgi:NhaP-type Na+/H+ or K+/H+ antiporter
MVLVTIFLASLFFYSLGSQRLERTVLTAPILFTAAGMLVHIVSPGLRAREGSLGLFLWIAEVGLVLLLFTDASRTDLRVLKDIRNLPTRLLSAGMLLTILFGAIAALATFPQLTLWEAGILAAILAPTDAGLGQIIVNSPRVPMRIRQALNVEAGLNDGLSVPFLLFFMALAGGAGTGDRGELVRFIGEQLGLGAVIGVAIGMAGGFLLRHARDRRWMTPSFEQLAVVTVPLLCLLASDALGASMFIAAFVAGLAIQIRFKQAAKHSIEFSEDWGQLLNLSVFFLFGLLVARQWDYFNLSFFLYAVISLTIVRMLPVALALIGTRLNWSTVLFMGWFGPRGLASIVLGLVYLEQESHHAGESTVRFVVMATVLLSIFAHGLSAQPGIRLYAAKIKSLGADAPENRIVSSEAGTNELGVAPTSTS